MKNATSVLLLCSFLFVSAQSQEVPTRNLTLTTAIDEALKNNLDLQIEMMNPEVSQALLSKSKSIFIPQFNISYSRNERNSPSTSKIEGGEIVSSNGQSLNFSLSQKLALGGTFLAQWDNSRGYSTSQFSSFNPSFNSTLTFSLSQPLLKNFGTFVTKRSIYTSLNNQEKALLTLEQRIIDLITQVEDAYWSLVYSHQQLEIQKQSLKLAQDQLRQNEIQVKVGVSAQMDILTAKAEVASRESQLLQTQSQIILYEQNLRKILNMSEVKEKIIPTDTPSFGADTFDFDKLLLQALDRRPDIRQVKLTLQSANIDVRYSRNQLLPDLSLSAKYYTTGVSGDLLIFEGNVFSGGTVTGVEKKSYWEAAKDVVSNIYRNYQVSLSLAIPLRNDSARADYVQAQISKKQALLLLKKTESTIYSDVKTAVMDLEAKAKIIEANRVSRELQEQKLRAEQKKYEVGLSTNYLILQFQRDLAQQQIAELQAIITYRLAIAQLNKVAGDTLEKNNLQIADFDRTTKD